MSCFDEEEETSTLADNPLWQAVEELKEEKE